MNKKIFLGIPGAISSFIALIMVFIPSFYQHQSKSTTYVNGHSSTSRGAKIYESCFSVTPGLGVFIVLLTLAVIALIIVTMATRNEKVAAASRIIIIIHMIFGIVVFFIGSCALSSSSTSGISGAWSSSGDYFSLGVSAWLYFVFSFIAGIFGFVSSTSLD